ncbi:OsmC family protein [Lacticaseibacillus baoqingensis]|uniref:OsmC family protein n=1 Tax=Lacticaseibacillus baoqingensis TaxID=2486013 RepID=A0ABW4E5C3_9LACO|nr:OsmC family protein [Lacticaseibacillus baoqingensis]
MDSLYHTFAVNRTGLPGTSYIDAPAGLQLAVSSPLTPAAGTNPEQLIGLALATCLNATLRLIEQRQHDALDAAVRVRVDMGKDQAGYQFTLTAQVCLPQHDQAAAQQLLAQAQRECPIAKLVASSANVSVRLVPNFTDSSAF